MHEAKSHHHTPTQRLSASAWPANPEHGLKRAEMIALAAACEAAVHDPRLERHVELVLDDVEAWARWACQNAGAAGWWEMADSVPAVAQARRRYAIARRLTGATITHETAGVMAS